MKTNAARLLDRLGVAYELLEYPDDPDDRSAPAVAAKVGLPPEQVFKTLVARTSGGAPVFAVVPGDAELDLKALAKLMGERKAALVPLAEVQPLTGYLRGGVTALAAKKELQVYVDASLREHDRVAVSAGIRGAQLLLAPDDYLRVTRATLGSLAKRA